MIALTLFLGCFVALAFAELLWRARPPLAGGDRRLATNFALAAANLMIVSMVPVSGVAASAWAQAQGIGVGHWLESAPALFALFLLVRSLGSYVLHRASHRFAPLWRLHRIHHADPEIDLSTALRNHPAEVLLAALVGAGCALAVGAPVWIATAGETVLAVIALWAHANLRLPAAIGQPMALLLVTPGVHLVHHSAERGECDSNYGDAFTLWDRVFGSYSPPCAPARLGLGDAADADADRLLRQLAWPLRR
ncbi:sterol desaturase family protein [Sphingomonas sp. LB-2]|uniref:sterol desaturase family protein n=1 Tax=Sphingomonas caeni TaxID=2984949 RepID=UPI002230DC81|nr:sterol desaturase family protein [Sphingomonas caeni]MCW3846846.1 sterol desaturase family protein [Sphingomonas caeni]